MKYLMDTDEWTVTIVDDICESTSIDNGLSPGVLQSRIKSGDIYKIQSVKLHLLVYILYIKEEGFPLSILNKYPQYLSIEDMKRYTIPLMHIHNFIFNTNYIPDNFLDTIMYDSFKFEYDPVSGNYVGIRDKDSKYPWLRA